MRPSGGRHEGERTHMTAANPTTREGTKLTSQEIPDNTRCRPAPRGEAVWGGRRLS